MSVYDQEQPEQVEDDPRWEVQPILEREEDSGGTVHTMLVALVAGSMLAALFVWLMSGSALGS